MAKISRRKRPPAASGSFPMNSSQTAYAVAGSCLVIAGLLLARGMMSGSSYRSGRVNYSDNPTMAEDANVWGTGGRRSGRRGTRRRPLRPMTPAELAMARDGLNELNKGRELFESAGVPGAAGEQTKLSDARTHLQAAQREFERIGGRPSEGLEAAIEECNRLLIQCNRRTILHVGR